MNVLLDTHAFLWYVTGDSRLSQEARAAIDSPGNDIFLSIASVWEMAIKHSLGKLMLVRPFSEIIPEQIRANGF